MNLKKALLLIFILFSISYSGCDPVTVETVTEAVELSRTIISLVNTFSNSNKEFSKKINDIVRINGEAVKGNNDIVEIASFWENNWNSINTDFANLRQSLSDIKAKADQYFLVLATDNSKLNNKSLKKADKEKNDQLQKKWLSEYNKAYDNLAKVENMLKEGNDYEIILRNSAMREQLSTSLSSLQDISNQANVLASNIQKFELNVTEIFKVSQQ